MLLILTFVLDGEKNGEFEEWRALIHFVTRPAFNYRRAKHQRGQRPGVTLTTEWDRSDAGNAAASEFCVR